MMSFSIEVAGEVSPLSVQELYHTLTAAASTDPQQIQRGTQQLQYWERQAGFHVLLQSLFSDTSLPTEVRHLCIIQLKNGIDKYWRKTATSTISKDEKDIIRSRCLDSGLQEPDHRLALQNALVISKIVRFEYPHDWPDAINSIVSQLRFASLSTASALRLSCALLILLEVMKEVSTARIQRTRTSLQSAASEVLQVLGRIYVDKVQTWMNFLNHGGDDEGGALESIEQSLLAARALRRLLIAGWDSPNRESQFQNIWNILNSHFDEMLSLVNSKSPSLHSSIQHLIEQHLRQISKLHLNMSKLHPAGFALLPDTPKLVLAYWSLIDQFGETLGSEATTELAGRTGNGTDSDNNNTTIMEFLSLKGLLLLRACVKMVFNPMQTFKYQQASDKEEKTQAKDLVKTTVLSERFVRTMVEFLVTRFFVFQPRDLKEWEEEPEEWERREEGEGDVWEFSVRSCSEKLFLDLMINFKSILLQPLLHVFDSVANTQNTDILLKDSIYSAIGLSAPVLEPTFDFNSFLTSTLGHEIQVNGHGYNILRRRAAIVLGQWLPVKDGLDRPLVYQIFQHLLDQRDPLNDQVVRVTAGKQLKNIIDPFEFTVEPFIPYAATILGHLMALIREVELEDTKMALLNTISVIVVRMETHITPFADQIISLLPPLWDQAGEEYLMKQSILGILSALMTSLKESSSRYQGLVIPLVHSSIEPNSQTRIYLLEDAMDLWSTVLSQTSVPISSELFALAQDLFPMFTSASDTLRKALEITDFYICLAPEAMLASVNLILTPLVPLLPTLKREAIGATLSIIELLVQCSIQAGGLDAMRQLLAHFVFLGADGEGAAFLPTAISVLSSAHVAHQTTGPNRRPSPLDPLAETNYLTILARLVLASPSLFLEAAQASLNSNAFHADSNMDISFTMSWLLDEWFTHMDSISHPEHKKLSCLAITSFLQIGSDWILGRLQELMSLWAEIVAELYDEQDRKEDCLVWKEDGIAGPETGVEMRRREMAHNDPVHQIDLKDFVRENLQQAIAANGGNETFQARWIVDVDQDVLKEFGKLEII